MIHGRHSRHTSSHLGFTLIELLVVISIIALLSSVVLAALNTARGKGKDAAIKQSAHEMQTVYAIEYTKNNSYSGLRANLTNGSIALAFTCSTVSSVISCSITGPVGCTNFYGAGSGAEKICLDVFNKGAVYSTGSNDNFLNTFAVFIPYPSSIGGTGRCLGSAGGVSDQTSSGNCYVSGIGW